MKRSWLLLSIAPLLAVYGGAKAPVYQEDLNLSDFFVSSPSEEEMASEVLGEEIGAAAEELVDHIFEEEAAAPARKLQGLQQYCSKCAHHQQEEAAALEAPAPKASPKASAAGERQAVRQPQPQAPRGSSAQRPAAAPAKAAQRPQQRPVVKKEAVQQEAMAEESEVTQAPPAKKAPAARKKKAQASTVPSVAPSKKAAPKKGVQAPAKKRQTVQNEGSGKMEVSQTSMDTMPERKGFAHFKMSADFLYWRRTAGMEFITDGSGISQAPVGSGTDVFVNGSGKSYAPNFGFKPGFKVSIGVNFARDLWDTNLTYTWMRHESERHFHRNPNNGLAQPINFFTEAQTYTQVSEAEESVHQTLYYSEWDLGRKIAATKWLNLRPSINVAGAYLPNGMRVSYHYQTTSPFAKSLVHRTEGNGLGFGGGIGLDTEWRLANCFSFQGNIRVSALWTHQHTEGSEHQTNLSSGVSTQTMKGHYSQNKMQYIRNIFLGADWHTRYHKDRYYFSLYAGWTFLLGFENSFVGGSVRRLSEESDYQGLNAGMRFDF